MAARRFCSSLLARATFTSLAVFFSSNVDIGELGIGIDAAAAAGDGCSVSGDGSLPPFPTAIIAAAATRPFIFLLPGMAAVDGLDGVSVVRRFIGDDNVVIDYDASVKELLSVADAREVAVLLLGKRPLTYGVNRRHFSPMTWQDVALDDAPGRRQHFCTGKLLEDGQLPNNIR